MSTIPWLAAAAAGAALVLTASGTASAATHLQSFGIAGSPSSVLYPGATGVIDLALTNPNDVALRLQDLTVTLTSITTAAGAIGPCTAADYAIGQLPANAGLVLPPHSSRTLSSLGVANADLPRLTMLNTAQNQDGCQFAVVNLHYHGDALGGGGNGGGNGDGDGHDHDGDGHDHDHDHDGHDDGSDDSDGDGDSGPTHTGTLPSTGGSHVQDMTAGAAALILFGTGTVAVIRRRRNGT
jgi:LPXTG-motif cell wall-anchored protein